MADDPKNGALDPQDEIDLHYETMELKVGPSHPATHGTVRIQLRLDGERIVFSEVEVGYLHRGFEKECESGLYYQAFPYTDRLNYVSPMINNVGYALAVEKLLGVTVPERCQYMRVVMSEISRIADHLTCLGMAAQEAGGQTAGFLLIEAREMLWDIVEAVTGARVTVSWCRVGGVTHDFPPDLDSRIKIAFDHMRAILDDCDKLLTRNRIFYDRMAGISVLTQEDAVSFGLTGPLLRSTGFSYDVRKHLPYLVYDRLDFEVPVGTKGDNYDRFYVRFLEILQSIRIVEQAMQQLPPGPIKIDDPRIVLPEKRDVYSNIEGLMNHFKLIMEGIKVPAGEAYQAVEGGNGELGFYIVSDGSGRPYRVRVRPPCFLGMGALGHMMKGIMIADIITTFGMINMIGGECDR